MSLHRYQAYGLQIESERPIASLATSISRVSGPADVEIIERKLQFPTSMQTVDGVDVSVVDDHCFLSIPECGRFEIVGGQQIGIEPEPGVGPEDVNHYLLGTVFGLLLHQRGSLPFHCSAIEHEGFAFLFCGDSGAGKSTISAYFASRGFRLLGDDLFALNFDSGAPLLAAGGPRRLKLWQNALDHLGLGTQCLRLVPGYDEKFEVRFPDAHARDVLPVRAIYHLRSADRSREPGIWALRGLQAANAITANIYRRRFADIMGCTAGYLSATARIVAKVPVFAFNRIWGFEHFANGSSALDRHIRQLVIEQTLADC